MAASGGHRRGLLASWALLAVALAVSLWVGASPRTAPNLDQRVHTVASEVRCPSCEDLTAADSNAPTAVAVRDLIRSQLRQGRSPAQIEAYLAARYGNDILLRPPARGVAGMVWVLPVAGGLAALGLLALAFRRWRRVPVATPDAGDRDLVRRALEPGP